MALPIRVASVDQTAHKEVADEKQQFYIEDTAA